MAKRLGPMTHDDWPEEGYIPEDAYPLQVIHQDDTGYVVLQIDAMDANSLIVASQIDFDYEGVPGKHLDLDGCACQDSLAVAREDIAGRELAPYRRLNLAAFFGGAS
jgi:hypothetical protein